MTSGGAPCHRGPVAAEVTPDAGSVSAARCDNGSVADFSLLHEVLLVFAGQQVLLHEDRTTPERVRAKHFGTDEDWVYGSRSQALIAVAGLSIDDPLIKSVLDAIERDRRVPLGGAAERHGYLAITAPVGDFYHVSSSVNRDSILTHGLNWRHMADEPGIAGSRRPEAEAVFLCRFSEDEFFVRMGVGANRSVDVWVVTMGGLWVHEEKGGWPMCFDPIEPARVRLRRSHEPAEAEALLHESD